MNAFKRAAGVNRSTYNWALGEWDRQYQAGGKPSAKKLKKQFNEIKGEQFPWVYESPRDANSQSFTDLNKAFQNFFKSRKGARKGPKVGYPQFHRKGVKDSFYVSNDKFSIRKRGKRAVVRLPPHWGCSDAGVPEIQREDSLWSGSPRSRLLVSFGQHSS